MLSPTESLGLAGATLEARVRRAAHHASDATLSSLSTRLDSDASANEIVYEREGATETIRIMLRPLLVMPDQLSYVHHVCLRLCEALKKVPILYMQDARVRRVLAITPEEESWFRSHWSRQHQRLNPIYGRLDAVCDFTGSGWQDSLHFMEPNLSGVGGIHYAPVAEQLVMRDVVPTLLEYDPELRIEAPRDQRDLFLQVLIDHARALGRKTCNLCFVEPKYIHEGPNEQSVLSGHLAERHGLTIVHADPTELRIDGDEVFYEDVRIDVIYRDYETRDLLALERRLGRRLDAIRLMFRQNRVISSMVGDFDHKSCWELLTDAAIAEQYFSAEECRLFRRHVLWTRVVGDRRTSLPQEVEGSLLDFAREHREQLVLKPNRGYGGTGVTMGAATSPEAWLSLLEAAAGQAEDPERSWVVQVATRLPVHEFPVVAPDGRAYGEPYHAVMGFAPTENGLGIMCRVSQKQVVNVAQHGGLAVVLIGHPPAELRVPKRASVSAAEPEPLLRAQVAELRHLDQAIGLLDWDEETMLPGLGRGQRGEQFATLEGLRHALLVSDRLGDLVEAVALRQEGDEAWRREIQILRRLRGIAMAQPEGLVRAFATAKSRALGAWEEARASDDYALFAPSFGQLVDLVRERAQALSHGAELYDSLLDEYEPGMTRARLDPVLTALRDRLVPIVQDLAERTAAAPPSLEGVRFPERAQWKLCRRILRTVGFDFARGRLDRSTHPFTLMAGANDVRLTIRPDEGDLTRAVLATLHEGGHGLYDQGFSFADRDRLLGDAPGLGLHEAQARLWENHVGRSSAFWQHIAADIHALFPESAGLSASAFHRWVNAVRPGVNRVSADQLSYHLHILLRYELELALLTKEVPVDDLPGVWDERTQAFMGLRPSSDREGVLQDVHWSLGMFGYFPTYTLGSLYAAQLIETYEKDHNLAEEIAAGEFAGLLNWLRQNVHQIGRRLPAEEIIDRTTGRGLDAEAFFRHAAADYDMPAAEGERTKAAVRAGAGGVLS
jgi:carboxypeptidase Taq